MTQPETKTSTISATEIEEVYQAEVANPYPAKESSAEGVDDNEESQDWDDEDEEEWLEDDDEDDEDDYDDDEDDDEEEE